MKLKQFLIFFAILPIIFAAIEVAQDGGYTGIVVGIDQNVPQGTSDVVNELTHIFEEASKILHQATNETLYFKEITIVIPSSWSMTNVNGTVSGSFFKDADIKVMKSNPQYGDIPYTYQPAPECGKQGEYIHLTPDYLTKKEKTGFPVYLFKNKSAQIVHEWSHYRYGVFDEYNLQGNEYPRFYIKNEHIYPSICMKGMSGYIGTPQGYPCTIDSTGNLGLDCYFIPDPDIQQPSASIMGAPFVKSVERFCSNTDNKTVHNSDAPTKHNDLCHWRSVSEVISLHPDMNPEIPYLKPESVIPKFNVVQQRDRRDIRYCFVLDVSSSMGQGTGRRLKLLKEASLRFFTDQAPDDSMAGIVTFNTYAKTRMPLTNVNDTTRTEFTSIISGLSAGGWTAIGGGLKEGIKVLANESKNIAGDLLILMTDGEETEAPYISEVINQTLESKVKICAISIGKEASAKVENLALKTGGNFYFIDDKSSVEDSYIDDFIKSCIGNVQDEELTSYELVREHIFVNETPVTVQAYIEESLGGKTHFQFIGEIVNKIDVTLLDPNMKIYDDCDWDHTNLKRCLFKFNETMPGLWMAIIKPKSQISDYIQFSLTSEPRRNEDNKPVSEPVMVKSWLSSSLVNETTRAKVFAEVKKGFEPLLNANVIAKVQRPDDKVCELRLNDNGLDPDIISNDGIYSGYFLGFNGTGRYSVSAIVNSSDNTVIRKIEDSIPKDIVMPTHSHQSSFSLSYFEVVKSHDEHQMKTEKSEQFQRNVEAGTFRVDKWNSSEVPELPPSRVNDLKLVEVLEDQKLVKFTYTTVGAKLGTEPVSQMQLAAQYNYIQLYQHFENASLFEDDDINSTITDDLKPGLLQEITVKIPDQLLRATEKSVDLYFAIRAVDGNLYGEVSNIVNVPFGIQKIIVPDPKPDDKSDGDGDSAKPWKVATGVLIVILVILAAIVIYEYVVKRIILKGKDAVV